ncbi:hypothetical protein c7_L670 [Megavirus courdo7]|uniref:Uncharacterized protein n=1 Tax=Megavirus courdo7 TaxID=1128135 RepID=H2EBG0_9VIRU|nr:hypothetical protein c7_L670 [Megavirus courdo7]
MNNTTLIDNIDIIEIADDIDNYDENIKLQDEIDDTELMDPFIGKKILIWINQLILFI